MIVSEDLNSSVVGELLGNNSHIVLSKNYQRLDTSVDGCVSLDGEKNETAGLRH